MKRNQFHLSIFISLFAVLSYWIFTASTPTVVQAQQSTETPTLGLFITVITDEPQINVRLGPSSSIYPVVGTLLRGATAPALGRSQGGDWVQIEYPGAPNNKGWVYSPLVQVSPPGILLVVEPPPTPVPPPTSTIDPVLAEQFKIAPTNTRLPTFTPPPPMAVTVYTQAPSSAMDEAIPVGIVILALFSLGVIGFLLSAIVRR